MTAPGRTTQHVAPHRHLRRFAPAAV